MCRGNITPKNALYRHCLYRWHNTLDAVAFKGQAWLMDTCTMRLAVCVIRSSQTVVQEGTCGCSADCSFCISWLKISGDLAAAVMVCSACLRTALSLLLHPASTASRSMLTKKLVSTATRLQSVAQACSRSCLGPHCHATSAKYLWSSDLR